MSYIQQFQISNEVIELFNNLHKKCLNYGLGVKNNNLLILEKLRNYKGKGCFVECGVFEGKTLLPSLVYSKENNLNIQFYGFDTFEGFPAVESNPKDNPAHFKYQYKNGLITSEHYEKAKKRTSNFIGVGHLEKEYFSDVAGIFDIESQFKNLELISGTFVESLPTFNKSIEILHIDCDLYQSYLDCLNNLYENIVEGGCVIFDEYFSLKYPGARDAVDEFFVDKVGHFENYDSLDNFERWCFVKDE
jgi:hypothetical protein